MSDRQETPSNSGSARTMLLRVIRPDGQTDEIYLARNLTIGRGVANQVMLADDETVGQVHARVHFCSDGIAQLHCLSADSPISVADRLVTELNLVPGVRFRIGNTDFECLWGQRAAVHRQPQDEPHCPHCGTTDVPSASATVCRCGGCGEPVLSLDLGGILPIPLVLPVRFGGFRAQQFVARGMGLVLKGIDESNETPVAIKLLLPDEARGDQGLERFQREISLLNQVDHPGVVKLLSCGRVERFDYLVLEWIDGKSLRDLMADYKARKQLSEFSRSVIWLTEVCEALAAIHAKGIVHRDIKPSNILIDNRGHARVLDLGIAKHVLQGQTELTTTGQTPGTYEYMAPEQLGAPDSVDHRTDQYSLGVTFYELLTGERPVGAWPAASAINPSVPPAFDEVLRRLLSPSPRDRYESESAVLAAICGPKPTEKRPRHDNIAAWSMVLAGAVVGAVIAVAAGLLLHVDIWVAALIGVFSGALVGKFTMSSVT